VVGGPRGEGARCQEDTRRAWGPRGERESTEDDVGRACYRRAKRAFVFVV